MCQLAWYLNSDRYDRSQTTDLNNSPTSYHPATALTGFVDYNSACRHILPQRGFVRWAWRARGGRGDIKREFRKKAKYKCKKWAVQM